jgi:calcium-translocating P-type ATPase
MTEAGVGPTLEGTVGAARWHGIDAVEAQQLLGSGPEGLSEPEAAERLARLGPNELSEQPESGALVVLARQLKSPLIFILLAAAAVTVALAEYIDAAVIVVAVSLNAVIGFAQERKAERAVRSLSRLVVPTARVVRGGREREIASRLLVPGDVVMLESGTRVPADLRLIAVTGLRVDESLLTGESMPVEKATGSVEVERRIADRSNIAYTGSIVTSGRGTGVVVATGASTELGAIAGLIGGDVEVQTPLQRRMSRFAGVIGIVVGASALTAFVSGVALGGQAEDMFLTAVALSVAAIPEGLPVAFTITLALGVHRMARRNAIVRLLPAVETLGSTTVIGSDKTGTLTENRMTVQEVWTGGRHYVLQGGPDVAYEEAHHPALHRTLLAGVLSNEAEVYVSDLGVEVSGDPTEVALLLSAMRVGIDPTHARSLHQPFAEIPFESEARYSAAVRERAGSHCVYVKGAPERLIGMCTSMLTDDGPVPLDPAAILDAAHDLAGRGLRVLAMAYDELGEPLAHPGEVSEPVELVFLGLQGMMDPPRAGVREAIGVCRDAGIRVVMITGDHAATARAIAGDLGIAAAPAAVLTGAELSALDDEALDERVRQVSVYARVAPEEKLRIVRSFQRQGEVVAVTGDGVNDAPALRAASIGIAMGKSGTDVAREAADMVLADDNFVSIAAAVEEGRVTFDNIRKVTFFLVSTGAGTITAILAGVWLQWPLLMLPAQLLWLNLVTNGLQDVALAFEPGEKDVLRRRPRGTDEGVISGLLWQRAAMVGLVMAAGTLVMFRWELDRTGSLMRAQTVALSTMVVFQAFQLGNVRSETISAFRLSPFSNRFLFASTIAALGVHVTALSLPPTQYVLRVEPLPIEVWLRIVAVGSTIILVVEIDKLLRRRTTRRTGR